MLANFEGWLRSSWLRVAVRLVLNINLMKKSFKKNKWRLRFAHELIVVFDGINRVTL